MESGRIPRLDPRASQQLAEGWKGLMVAGVLAMLVGCVAIVVPAAASVATAVFIGWILIIAGASSSPVCSVPVPPDSSWCAGSGRCSPWSPASI